MHFMVSFEIESDPARQAPILDEMRSCLAPHPHVEAVRNAFVVNVMGYGVYESVQKKLLDTARRQEAAVVRFVMTPLINRGLYHGRLRQEAADQLNTLTD